jgi:hypothetical protein
LETLSCNILALRRNLYLFISSPASWLGPYIGAMQAVSKTDHAAANTRDWQAQADPNRIP